MTIMPYLFAGLACLGLLFLYNCAGTTSVWLHYTLSPFIYGASKFKLDFLLAFSMLLALLATTAWKIKRAAIITRINQLLAASILIALLANTLSFFVFIHRFSLPLDKYSYYFKGPFHSINYFAHIHTGKAIIFQLLRLLGLNSLNNHYDTGLVFAAYIPAWITIPLALSVVLAFIFLLTLLKPTVDAWPRRRAWAVFIIFAFAGGHILKCLVDGGLFSYDLLPALFALQLLLSSVDSTTLLNSFRQRLRWYIVISVLYLGCCALISFDEGIMQVPFGFAFMSSVYYLLFLPLWLGPARSHKTILAIFCSIVVIALYWSMHGLSAIKTMNEKIGQGDRVLLFNYPLPSGPPLITDQTKQLSGKTILEAYRALGEDPLRNRRLAIIKTGEEPYTGFIFVLKIIQSDGTIKLNSDQLIRINKISPFPQYGKQAYLMNISFNPDFIPPLWSRHTTVLEQNNKYCMLFLLNHYFAQKGITEYALVPFYYFDVSKLR